MSRSGPTPRKKRLLVLTPRMPFPFHSGERWVLALLKHLSPRYEISLFTFLSSDDLNAVAYSLRLEKDGLCRVHALAAPPARGQGVGDDCPDAIRPFYSASARSELRRIVAENPPDVVHIHFMEMAHYVKEIPASIPTVLTEHDVSHFWPNGSYLRETGKSEKELNAEIQRRRSHAQEIYRRFTMLTALSSSDARQLESLVGTGEVKVVALSADVEGLSARVALPESSVPFRDLLFVGNYRHYPNEEAAIHLCRDILPILRGSYPSATLRLAGACPTPEISALAGPGVDVTGAVASLRPYLNASRVFVAPVRLGSGVKGKVLEAFAAGLPVVASSRVAAGFDEPEAREAMLIGDDPRQFSEAIGCLLGDESLRSTLSRRGSELARARYDDRRAAADFAAIYESLLRGVPEPGHAGSADSTPPISGRIVSRVLEILEDSVARGRGAGLARAAEPIREFYLEATHRCDLRCFMCEHWSLETRDPGSAKRELSVSEIESVLASSRLLDGVEQVVVTGGEPWLRGESARLVAILARRFPEARLIVLTNLCNGGLLGRRLEELRRLGVRKIHLGSSLDGLGEVHDGVRGRPGAFSAVLETVGMLRREHPGVSFGFTFTITPRNYEKLYETFRFVTDDLRCDFGAQFIVQTDGIERIHWPAGAYEKIDRQIEEILIRLCSHPAVRGEIEQLLAGGGGRGVRLWRELIYWSRLRRINIVHEDLMDDCLSGRRYAMIDPEGNVFFCPVGRKNVIGSVRSSPFDDIWVSKEAELERARIASCQCKAWIRCIAHPIVDRFLTSAGR